MSCSLVATNWAARIRAHINVIPDPGPVGGAVVEIDFDLIGVEAEIVFAVGHQFVDHEHDLGVGFGHADGDLTHDPFSDRGLSQGDGSGLRWGRRREVVEDTAKELGQGPD